MTDRESLLKAIIHQPDENTNRLVYADCLLETGEESDAGRARFIWLQHEREMIGPRRHRVAAVVKEAGPDYWYFVGSDLDGHNVGDRVDVQCIAVGKKSPRVLHGVRITKVEKDDAALGTVVVSVTQDEHSVPYPGKKVKRLDNQIQQLFLKNYFRWVKKDLIRIFSSRGIPQSVSSIYAFPCRSTPRVLIELNENRFVLDSLGSEMGTGITYIWLTYQMGFISKILSTWFSVRNHLDVLVENCPIRKLSFLQSWPFTDSANDVSAFPPNYGESSSPIRTTMMGKIIDAKPDATFLELVRLRWPSIPVVNQRTYGSLVSLNDAADTNRSLVIPLYISK